MSTMAELHRVINSADQFERECVVYLLQRYGCKKMADLTPELMPEFLWELKGIMAGERHHPADGTPLTC